APGDLARVRNRFSRRIFPITSTTHSLSRADYARAFLHQLWNGTTARDCIVATSRAAVDVVRTQFEELRQGYGLESGPPSPVVEHIPLGLPVSALMQDESSARDRIRDALGASPGHCLILVLGRISHHSKMDILPLLRALRRVVAQGLDPGKIMLVIAGWTEDRDDTPETLRVLARSLGLTATIIPRPSETGKRELLQGVDIFCSLADNLQETFGLTLLEAGAAGLPVLASDFDGYRDLVDHGRTGFLVPTLAAPAMPGLEALAPLLPDNQYHLVQAQATVVSVSHLASWLAALVADPGLRRALGRQARKRVQDDFAWPQIITRHLDLWDRLNRCPVPEPDALRDVPHPSQVHYARVFAGFSTKPLSGDDIVQWSDHGRAVYRGQDHPAMYAGLEPWLNLDQVRPLLTLAHRPVIVSTLLDRLAGIGLASEAAAFLLHWALKHDLLELCDGVDLRS
ncbi:MAG: glycosyltransferase, partial [Deltaproteobacteria bacterium]|nr:glycosyltransferase [Deltaproteobacteria bacterium]